MRIGFTGTRHGMNRAQLEQLTLVLCLVGVHGKVAGGDLEFHHGGQEGAETEAWGKARRLLPQFAVHVHPMPGIVRESPLDGATWHEVLPPLRRNRDIVLASELLVAAPLCDQEVQRSGTWATVRYARAAGLPVVMLSRGGPR